jgi:hypothetical protein
MVASVGLATRRRAKGGVAGWFHREVRGGSSENGDPQPRRVPEGRRALLERTPTVRSAIWFEEEEERKETHKNRDPDLDASKALREAGTFGSPHCPEAPLEITRDIPEERRGQREAGRAGGPPPPSSAAAISRASKISAARILFNCRR